jgi:hypothetical protein
MMKKLLVVLVAVAFLFSAGQAMAEYIFTPGKMGVHGQLGTGEQKWRKASIEHIMCDRASITTVTSTSAKGSFSIPLTDFMLSTAGSGPLAAVASITQTVGFDRKGGIPCLNWGSPVAIGAGSKIIATFDVPRDYSSGLGFRAWLGQSDVWDSASPYSIDWSIYVMNGTDVAGSDEVAQTQVALVQPSPDIVTLAINANGRNRISSAVRVALELWATRSKGQLSTINALCFGVEGYYTKVLQ